MDIRIYKIKHIDCFLLTIALLLFILNSSSIWAAPENKSGPKCVEGEVRFEGGAIACPTCSQENKPYVANPEFNEEVNKHMERALNDNLESSKWLINYFSQEKTKNHVEAKKWFGRALALGAKGEELRLVDGYDEHYLTTAHLNSGQAEIKISSSCLEVKKK